MVFLQKTHSLMDLHSGGTTFPADAHIHHLQLYDPVVSRNGRYQGQQIVHIAWLHLNHIRGHLAVNPLLAMQIWDGRTPPALRVMWALLVLKMMSTMPLMVIGLKWEIFFPTRLADKLYIRSLNLSNGNVASSNSVVIAYPLRLQGRGHGVVLQALFASTSRVCPGVDVPDGISLCVGLLRQYCNDVIVQCKCIVVNYMCKPQKVWFCV